jgi:pimeloyl-ACP methyl ester carboxylesterase
MEDRRVTMRGGNGQSRFKAAQTERVIPFRAGDGFQCNLLRVSGSKPPSRGPVLLVHGAGVRANIFRAPVQTTIVDFLIDRGYDVWLENWRASIDLKPNPWTLDQAAVHDHPHAVKIIVKETGCSEIKAIIHCQGSTSFTMSAMAGLVPEVKVIVSNAVSLHTVVPGFSTLKLNFALPVISRVTPCLNPQWGLYAPTLPAKVISMFVAMVHHECHNPVCKQVSFTYGSGFPALWRHENLNDQTHEWLKQEFAAVPISFFRQMRRCVHQGHLVSVEDQTALPRDFTAQPPKTEARFAFFAGARNQCFLPDSQRRSYEFFSGHHKDYHSLHIIENYSHLDIFMGQAAARDVFPLMEAELEQST